MSDLEQKSDYDNNEKGMVDYDDFDIDDDDEFKPSRPKRTPSTSSSGRGRGSQGRGRGRGRGRPRIKPVSIDPKALAKVHRTVAGTDYDFENEFEDDFGAEKNKADLSLQVRTKDAIMPYFLFKCDHSIKLKLDYNRF